MMTLQLHKPHYQCSMGKMLIGQSYNTYVTRSDKKGLIAHDGKCPIFSHTYKATLCIVRFQCPVITGLLLFLGPLVICTCSLMAPWVAISELCVPVKSHGAK